MSKNKWDSLWLNAHLVTCEGGYGLQANAAIAVKDKQIIWRGAMHELPGIPEQLAHYVYDVQHRCITPGFIDCHTHLVYAANRALEFEQRLQGVSYESIIQQGGGIQSTVNATRLATEDELLQQAVVRAKCLMASGVTTLEIKSGYGLDWATELKILTVAQRIATVLPLTVRSTFLGAHIVPADYRQRADAYVDLICDEMLPRVADQQLAVAVDVFCEKIAFTLAQTERVFKAARQYGLAIKCHAEQLSHMGAAALAARYGAWSVDHLEYITEQDVLSLARNGTIAVLLPGAFYYLHETQQPPIALLRQHKVPMAIASDCNPGTSPIMSLLLILNMACTLFRLTPEEALLGVTYYAAQALGLGASHGSLAIGKVADLAIWDVAHPAELVYYLGAQPLCQLVKNGEVVIAN